MLSDPLERATVKSICRLLVSLNWAPLRPMKVRSVFSRGMKP
jgi:hypothetical protein